MIELASSTAFMLYLAATLSALFVLSIIHYISSTKQSLAIESSQLYVCEYCLYAYLADSSEEVSRCPNCSSFNKDNKYNPKKHK